jgi:septal ring factor EnvC (AmiA/AmiB activator)
MFSKDFDPLGDLQKMAKNQEIMAKNINEMVKAINERSDTINQLVTQINLQDLELTELHNRVRLLEAARQYDKKD